MIRYNFNYLLCRIQFHNTVYLRTCSFVLRLQTMVSGLIEYAHPKSVQTFSLVTVKAFAARNRQQAYVGSSPVTTDNTSCLDASWLRINISRSIHIQRNCCMFQKLIADIMIIDLGCNITRNRGECFFSGALGGEIPPPPPPSFKFSPQTIKKFVFMNVFHIFSPHKSNFPPTRLFEVLKHNHNFCPLKPLNFDYPNLRLPTNGSTDKVTSTANHTKSNASGLILCRECVTRLDQFLKMPCMLFLLCTYTS